MRACPRCGYDSADHLSYCVQCGRRFASSAGDPAPTGTERTATPFATTLALAAGGGDAGPLGPTTTTTTPPTPTTHAVEGGGLPLSRASVFRQAAGAVRYVFAHLRGRADAGARRKRLAEERDGALRLAAAALVDLGRRVLAEGVNSPELNGLLEAVGAAQARREAAMAEAASTEAFRGSEDARLGQVEKGARAEIEACEGRIRETERALQRLDEERLQRMVTPAAATSAITDPGASAPEGSAEARRAHVQQETDALRERAAALHAAVLAARTKLDHALAARRQAAASLEASLVGHQRQRSEAERRILELTTQVGRVAWQTRLADPRLLPSYERIDRHHQTLAEREHQIALVEMTVARYDRRKLAAGIGVLAGIAGAIVAAALVALWALLR